MDRVDGVFSGHTTTKRVRHLRCLAGPEKVRIRKQQRSSGHLRGYIKGSSSIGNSSLFFSFYFDCKSMELNGGCFGLIILIEIDEWTRCLGCLINGKENEGGRKRGLFGCCCSVIITGVYFGWC